MKPHEVVTYRYELGASPYTASIAASKSFKASNRRLDEPGTRAKMGSSKSTEANAFPATPFTDLVNLTAGFFGNS